MDNKILLKTVTRKHTLVKTFYQTEQDIENGMFSYRGKDCGGGGKLSELLSNLANDIVGTYILNEVRYLKVTDCIIDLQSNLKYIVSGFGLPYFIGKDDFRYNSSRATETGIVKVTGESMIKWYENIKHLI